MEPDQAAAPDASHDLDLVTIMRAAGVEAEVQAMSVKSLLEANGIDAFLIGDTRLPNLPYQVRVPRGRESEAKQIIADALSAGPEAAEEAERASESGANE